jgi:hypothetical protein
MPRRNACFSSPSIGYNLLTAKKPINLVLIGELGLRPSEIELRPWHMVRSHQGIILGQFAARAS